MLTPCRECARFSSSQKMVGVAEFEPATSSFRTKSASRLRYTPEMARCTGLEPVSLDRQSSGLTRCITAQTIAGEGIESVTAIEKSGVPGSTRTSTERALNAFPLPLGYRHTGGPGRIRTCDGHCQRIKSPPRSAATVTGPRITERTRVVTIHRPTG